MSKIIVLYNYNKYYNRIVKKLATFADYQALITPIDENTPAAFNGFTRNKVNFDYQDGVYATLVLNIAKSEDLVYKVDQPDYCVVETEYKEGEGVSQTTVKQLSRWFILESTKIRGNQWEISLKRDVLADYYEAVINSPVFIERGNISDPSNPLLFNAESLTFNQIKQGELLLDFTKLSGKKQGWIVGYTAREESPTDIGPCVAKSEAPASTIQYNDLPQDIKDALTRGYYSIYNTNQVQMSFYARPTTGTTGNVCSVVCDVNNNWSTVSYFPTPAISIAGARVKYDPATTRAQREAALLSCLYETYKTNFKSSINNLFAYENTDAVTTNYRDQYNGIIYEKDGILYQLNIDTDVIDYWEKEYTASQINSQSDAVANMIYNYSNALANNTSEFPGIDWTASGKSALVSKQCRRYNVYATQVDYNETKVTLKATRNQNFEAPYDLFCLPFGTVNVKSSGSVLFSTVDNISLSIARAISIKGTTSKVYDIQILPYCPFDEILNSDGDIDITGFTNHYDYDFITKDSGGDQINVGIVVYPKKCKGTFDLTIPYSDTPADIYNRCIEKSGALEKKLSSLTEFVRFVSPNFASTFQMDVQKNKGITLLNVDYFYKPYSPYIHVAPYFNGLYGQDYNDPKGLICGGEFSIATASDQWQEYQIQNKNYELIFNRQIQNMDVNYNISLSQEKISSGIGIAQSTLTGLAGGAAAGAMVGSFAGPAGTLVGAAIGAVGGAITGAVTSAVGRKYDLEYLKQQHIEARDYSSDMYAYSLGNIQALPYTLTRVSTFTPNNKIFPFIEFYDCTEVEISALTNKLMYNGMSIGVIGKIKDYLGNYNYVQGTLIRLTGINEDSHVVAEIANEIKQGAYYYGTNSE